VSLAQGRGSLATEPGPSNPCDEDSRGAGVGGISLLCQLLVETIPQLARCDRIAQVLAELNRLVTRFTCSKANINHSFDALFQAAEGV